MMSKFTLYFYGLIISCIVFSCTAQSQSSKKELKNEKEKFSYAIGMEVGSTLFPIKEDLEFQSLLQGIMDTLKGNQKLLSQAEAMQIRNATLEKIQAKMLGELGEKHKKDGASFLEKNKQNKDVVTTQSGLQYQILKQGTGPKPTLTDKVKVHYKGTLIDGKEFDSSYRRNEPAVLQLNGVIKGWTEALQMMNTGSTYRLFIPSDLAYGANGMGSAIPPNATLIFDVELIGIEK